jgi:hypothetical protein
VLASAGGVLCSANNVTDERTLEVKSDIAIHIAMTLLIVSASGVAQNRAANSDTVKVKMYAPGTVSCGTWTDAREAQRIGERGC